MWLLPFGDFGNFRLENKINWILFVIWTILLPILGMNLLIAFFSDTYTRVYEQRDKASYAELVRLILDLELILCCTRKVKNKNFLIFGEKIEEDDLEDDIMTGIGQKVSKVNINTQKSIMELK